VGIPPGRVLAPAGFFDALEVGKHS
jgi:hypothetical protein